MKIAIMGFGVVGSGVGEIISTTGASLMKRCGEEIEIAKILDLRDFPDSKFKCFTKDFNDILNDPEIGLVVEVMAAQSLHMTLQSSFCLPGSTLLRLIKSLSQSTEQSF